METNQHIIESIKKQGMLPLFYHADQSLCIELVKTLYDAGIRVVEFTNRGGAAFANFKALVNARDAAMPGMLLATGTIRTAEEAAKYRDAGADFLISPVFDPGVCDEAYMSKTLWIPGCMTPTEIHVAENAGCRLVKLFPGNILGPSFVSGIKELFPAMEFMPTGGVEVNKENISEWFRAGVCAVGLGSKLISKEILNNKDYKKLASLTAEALAIIKAIRS